MAFNNRPSRDAAPTDPAHLYRILATQSSEAPENLWYHQGEILSTWHSQHRNDPDVALELPTGAGKTLVGGVIAEFQRRSTADRTAYVCPTRQLAKQTTERLVSYGISAVALTGPVKAWPEPDKAMYRAAQAVAVTTYAHVFNSNPAIDDAQLLVLDDSHAAADAAAKPWSLSVRREEHHATYIELLSQLREGLDPLVVTRLTEEHSDAKYRNSAYLASPIAVRVAGSSIGTALRTAADVPNFAALSKDATYALRMIEDHLEACLYYVSHREILIRPLIPPTANHAAFDSPARRIYMSATLGAGGELERAFGRRRIARIPVPSGWEKQGTGRRLFCVPDLADDLAGQSTEIAAWVQSEVIRHERAVLITPDRRTATEAEAQVIPPGFPVVRADQVEEDLSAFTNLSRGVLVLTNRYDGIDLPDEDCRLVILSDLPAQGDLQERFLYSSLGAHEVLQERIRARIAQGAGRATRNSRDYATVIVLGTNLIRFATRHDVRGAMHPEIHAEMDFGWANSLNTTSSEMTENVRVFIEHADEWLEVEKDLASERELLERSDPPGTPELAAAARHEVAAWQAIWNGEVDRAITSARAVLDAIGGTRAPQRYAALWNYLAACWTTKQAASSTEEVAKSLQASIDSYYQAARACGRGTTWLGHLASPADERPPMNLDELDPLDYAAIEGLLNLQATLGRPAKFASTSQEMRSNLKVADADVFEAGLVSLGSFLGATESFGNGRADSAPDAMWLFAKQLWVSCEAKTEAKANGETGANSIRQADGHLRFTSNDRNESTPVGSFGLLITPEARIHPAAVKVAGPDLYRVRPDRIVALAERAIRAWGVIRAIPNLDHALAAQAMRAERLLPSQWVPEMCSETVIDLV